MKKNILLLLILMMIVLGISYTASQTTELDNEEESASSSLYPNQTEVLPSNIEADTNVQNEHIEVDPIEKGCFNPNIPLTCEEQNLLRDACNKFGVPYALALGLIEKETGFKNIIGDDGASFGYMQVAEKWHRDGMERLGVTNLLDPNGNFQVGLDYLSELYQKNGNWDIAITVYNNGHNPGYVSDYAKEVMSNYAYWEKLIENDI